MPVTIQKNKVKFKDPNNQGFITLDAIGSESAQEIQSKINGDVSNAIKNLNDAAAAANVSADTIAQAVNAAVAQGTDPNLILSGVPADAKAAGESITYLKNAITHGKITITTFVQGTRSSSTGYHDASNLTRCTTEKVYLLKEGDRINISNIDSGLRVALAGYKNNTNIYDSGWQTSNFTYKIGNNNANGASFYINISNASGSGNISPESIHSLTMTIVEDNILSRAYTVAGRLFSDDDLNSLFKPGMYRVTHDSAQNWKPQNWPSETGGNILVMRGNEDIIAVGTLQLVYLGDRTLYRFGTGNTDWTQWETYYAEGYSPSLNNIFSQTEITYRRGGYYASGAKGEASDQAISTNLIRGGGVITLNSSIGRILLYRNGTYIGKVNSNYEVDQVAGSWWSFTNTIDMYKLLYEKNADSFILVLLPNNSSDAPTVNTYQAWGQSHCTIYSGVMYGLAEIRTRCNDLPEKAYLKKGILTNGDNINTLATAGFYRVYSSSIPTGWPATRGGNLLVARGDFAGNVVTTGICQIVWVDQQTFVRFSGEGIWTDWQSYYSEGHSPDVTALKSGAYTIKGRITGTTDIDTLKDQGFYRVSRDSTNTWAPVNWPYSGGGNLLVMKGYPGGTSTFGNCQIIYGNDIRVRFGTSEGTAWTDWQIFKASGTGSDIVALNNEEETILKLRQLSSHRSLSTTLERQPLVLLHFSDLHMNTDSLQRIIDFKNHYSTFIHDVIHTGDTINNIANGNVFSNVAGAEAILNVIGNHDTWDPNGSWTALTEAETNTRFIAPYVANWGTVTVPTGKCYYYKDYSDNNVRLIVLDCMHINSEQLTWFTNTLNTARENSYHVIIANHTIMGRLEDMTYLDSGFDNPTYPRDITPNYGFPMFIPTEYVTAVDNFISAGGVVVAWLSGHMHNDTFATYHNILNIAVTTAGDYSGIGRTTDMRVQGTRSQDAFNIYGINTLLGQLYGMRVGMNYNAVMKKVDTFCWDYINHKLIYTS